MIKGDLLAQVPSHLPHERFDTIVHREGLVLERIVSKGHRSPKSGWYEQARDEWVLLFRGAAVIGFERTSAVTLRAGEHLFVPAGLRHRVLWTDPSVPTIWLALHCEPERPVTGSLLKS